MRNFARIMSNKTNLTFVMNPISGTVKKAGIPDIIAETLHHDRFSYRIAWTEYAGHAEVIAREEVEAGTDIVVAVGGDGTVNEVGRALIGTKSALAIVPCGSGNGLARHLMLPMDIRKSIEVINQCEVHQVDYGIINEHPFFCTCGMGFDAFISQKFAEAGKRGMVTYVENVLREGLTYKPETYFIEDEQGTTIHKAFLISCANASQYGNNAYIAPQASMTDGLLDVIIMEPFDVLEAPQVAIEMMNKTLDKNQKIKTFRTQHIHIRRKHDGWVHFDGDPLFTSAEIDIRLMPRGIKMVVNGNADKSKRQPNMVQTAFSEFFNDLNVVRDDLIRQGRHIQAINKVLLRKLNNL